jgi:hypothetical protein
MSNIIIIAAQDGPTVIEVLIGIIGACWLGSMILR